MPRALPEKYLVLQTHYMNLESLPSDGDTSGVYLHYTYVPQPKAAAMISVHVNTYLPGRSITHQDAVCKLSEDKVSVDNRAILGSEREILLANRPPELFSG